MRCFEILVNGKRVALVGHEAAERLTAEIETNRNIDVAVVDLVAEFPVRQAHATYASWPGQTLKMGDEITIRVVDVPSADEPATIVTEDLGQVSEHQGNPWPMCATCGKPWHQTEGMVSGRGVHLCDACLKQFAAIRQL
jgi:hypothetical protein